MAPSDPAEHHRRVAGAFHRPGARHPGLGAPAPVPGWTACDGVDHLCTWFPGLLASGGIELGAGPAVADDPVAAWQAQVDAVQALLDDPATAG